MNESWFYNLLFVGAYNQLTDIIIKIINLNKRILSIKDKLTILIKLIIISFVNLNVNNLINWKKAMKLIKLLNDQFN